VTDHVFAADWLFDGREVLPSGWLRVEHGIVQAIGTGRPPRTPDANSEWLTPGLVDTHCHGGGGAAFTDGADASRQAIAAHLAHGTTSLVASLVSAPLDDLADQLSELVPLVEQGELAGIHLEGPWLAPEKSGAHDRQTLRAPQAPDIERLLAAGRGSIISVTLAPELSGALEAIAQLRSAGVLVAVGHTAATGAQVREAVEAGATMATHLFNAMPPLEHRDPGPVGALLTDDRITVELIDDGAHVAAEMLDIACAAAGDGRWMLVTDAMSAAACGDGPATIGALAVDVVDGVARRRDTGALAGSTLVLSEAVRRRAARLGDFGRALRAATSTPARVYGFADTGRLAVGVRADAVAWDVERRVVGVWRGGEPAA